jgi:hypothetical protein
VHGKHLYSQGTGGSDGPGDLVGNVVEFEIQENTHVSASESFYQPRTLADKELHANLVELDPAGQEIYD